MEKKPRIITFDREAIGSYTPTPGELRQTSSIAEQFASHMEWFIDSNGERISRDIEEYRLKDPTSVGSELTAKFSHILINPVLERQFQNNSQFKADMIFWHDYKYGFNYALGILLSGLAMFDEGQGEDFSEFASGIDRDIVTQTQIYMEGMAEATDANRRLISAGSAEAFLRQLADEVKIKPNPDDGILPKRITHEVPEYFASGVDLAARVFPRVNNLVKSANK